MKVNKIKACLVDWWFSRKTIFRLYFVISTDSIFCNASILDYGLRLCIDIPNLIPFYFKPLCYRNKDITANKFFEEELFFTSNLACGIITDWTIHQNHCGFNSEISMLGLTYSYKFIDKRHWDYKRNKVIDGVNK